METNIFLNNQNTTISSTTSEIITVLNDSIINVETSSIDITLIDNGIQGIKGASGKFEELTELQKSELLDSTALTNYTNLFNNVLLS